MAQAAQAPNQLEGLFDRLHQLMDGGSHSKVVKVAEQILKAAPGDPDALACKAVALLQDQEYEAADKVLQHKAIKEHMPLERAYCCYRLGRFEESLKLLADVSEEQSSCALQLAAQVNFRLDKGQACAEAYDKLKAAGQVSTLEQKTNFLAAYVSAGLSAQLPQLMSQLGIKPRDSFEIGFNRATGLAAAGDLEAAETAVKAAYKQGEEALLDDEYTEEEVLGELAPLTVLLAYLLIASGHSEEAVERLQPIIAGELPQREVAAIAANNWAVACFNTDTQQKGFYGRSLRKLEALLDKGSSSPLALDPDLASRMSGEQVQLLHLNRALLYYLSGKLDQAQELSGHLATAYPGDPSVNMLQAVLLAKSGKAAEADALLSKYTPKAGGSTSPIDAARPTLLRAQLALEAGNVGAALGLLQQGLPSELVMKPAVVATRVALLEQIGDSAGAEALLQSALKHWQGAASARPRDPAAAAGVSWCLQRLVALKVSEGHASEAMTLYLQLSKLGPAAGTTSSAALAKLARAAAAAGDADAIQLLQKQLPAAYVKLGQGLDLDALEAAATAIGTGSRRREEAVSKKRDAAEEADGEGQNKKKPKRKRKPHYPKGYDPSKPNGGLPAPDPERWLPKWQRSDAKKKQKRRRDRTEQVKGSQGAGKVDEALDRAAKGPDKADEGKAGSKPQLPNRPAGKGKGGRR